jgi:precorrin-8X/cobalt-precorrin-8 methylmutase
LPAEPLFDAYVMVDWSAAAVPRLGRDSIWLCHLSRMSPLALREREGPVAKRREGEGAAPAISLHGRRYALTVENLATRHAARDRLLMLLRAECHAGRAVLAGFDFAFGYPSGLAARLALDDPPWQAMWTLLAEQVSDAADNDNNRFAVGAALNRRISGGVGPFWGCPAKAAGPCLEATHHHRHDALGLAERRLADVRLRGPQPVWKLFYTGSVGGQALTGIPVLRWLRNHPDLAAATRVWPFETGLRPLRRRDTEGRIVLAEIYPSLVEPMPEPGEVKDAGQVRAIARHFAGLDAAGELAPIFGGDTTLDDEQRRRVESEESWILGVTRASRTGTRPGRRSKPSHPARASARGEPKPSPGYLKSPRAIYKESFRIILETVDLARFPEELHPVVLRLIHATAEPALAGDLVWSEGAVAAGRTALAAGAPILVDAAMVASGIITRALPKRNRVRCFLDDRRVPALVKKLRTTRSAAAVELWRPALGGAIIAIGNAPTALFHLLEIIAAGAATPALVLGFPVGFVGAAEAKAALAANRFGLPFIALRGRRGGSALAAAAVNALAKATP